MQVKNKAPKPLCLRACASVYLVFAIICGVPLIMCLVVALYKDRTFWQPVAFCLLAMAFFFLWLRSYKLVMSDDGILYRMLFRGTISLALSEIDKIEVEAGCSKYSDRFRPTIRMIFEPKPFVQKPRIVVNLKVFSRKDIVQLDNFINSKLKGLIRD